MGVFLKAVEGIGIVDEKGEVFIKEANKGTKGFKVVEHNGRKIVYSLEEQRKLLEVSIDDTVEIHEKVVVVNKAGSNDAITFNNLEKIVYSLELNEEGKLIAVKQSEEN